jgi:methylphosphotriester-DNA--protein-cysteine methyltransferase
MAADAGLPERTFKRRFVAATGYTPLDYVQTLRTRSLSSCWRGPTFDGRRRRRDRLEEPAFFRRPFKRRESGTPARYRHRFARIARIA